MEKKDYLYEEPKKIELSEYVRVVLSGIEEYSERMNEKTVQIFTHGQSSYYVNSNWET